MSINIDEIEARLTGKPVHICIEPPPSKREVRYLVAGAFAALLAGVVIAGVVA